MHAIWWLAVGVAGGAVAMLPVVHILLRRGEERARKAERRARDAERLAELGSMTGGLAHEIKNPLSTIGLNAQLLAEGLDDSELPVDQRERLKRRLDALRREAERLRGILTDFLQFAGRIKLDPHRKDVSRIADEACDFFLPQCDQARVVMRTQMSSEPAWAMVDESLLKQAILNLMINAVQAMDRHAPKGAPSPIGELIVRVEAREQSIEIHVIDTGPGIEPAKQAEIFRPYVSGRQGGTGLGLSIARRIVEEHGGTLALRSDVGQGSDFVITLPPAASAEAPAQHVPSENAAG